MKNKYSDITTKEQKIKYIYGVFDEIIETLKENSANYFVITRENRNLIELCEDTQELIKEL